MGQELSQLKQSTKPDHVILSQAMEKIAEVESAAVKHEKGMAKSKSAYSHFADYSMFPDRFNEKTTVVLQQTPIEIERSHIGNNPDYHHHHGSDDHFSDYSLFPDKFNDQQCRIKRSVSTVPSEQAGTSLPATSGFLSKYSSRLRSSSVSESEHGNDNFSPPSSGGGDEPRPRSLSNSRMYYFDFTMIPDKGGNFTYDERKRHRFDGINKQDWLKVPQVIPEGSSVPSSLPAQSSMEDIAQKVKRSRQASEPRDRFGFFDYSNYPDKDPKCFNKKQD